MIFSCWTDGPAPFLPLAVNSLHPSHSLNPVSDWEETQTHLQGGGCAAAVLMSVRP